MERRRWLGDLLAGSAGELLPHRLDHLPLARDDFQCLGDILAERGQPAAADRARAGSRNNHPLAWQMSRQGCAHRPLAGEALHGDADRLVLGCDCVLAGLGFQLLALQLQLIEHFATARGRLAVLFAPELGDHQLHMRDQRFGTRCAGRGRGQFLALSKDQRVRLGEIGREWHGGRHASAARCRNFMHQLRAFMRPRLRSAGERWLSQRAALPPSPVRFFSDHGVRCKLAVVLIVGSSVRILNAPSAVSIL